jgi:hypothetical protein
VSGVSGGAMRSCRTQVLGKVSEWRPYDSHIVHFSGFENALLIAEIELSEVILRVPLLLLLSPDM